MASEPSAANEEPSLSAADIAEITARCEQATAGPWKSWVERRDGISGSDFIETGGEDIYLTGATTADQDFIAHSRQDVPRLVAEVARLQRQFATRAAGL